MGVTRNGQLLAYCKLDEADLTPDEVRLLETMFASAECYMTSAGVAKPAAEDTGRLASYDLCVNAIVLDSWDRRDTSVSEELVESISFRRLLNQLKFSEPESEN